jgi:Lrp/AsnC family transcriptional regulator for asnA, asnC and gidA
MIELDELDHAIIKMLRANGRLTNAAVAKMLATPETTVRQRLRRLLDTRSIRVGLVVDAASIRLKLIAYLRLDADPKLIDSVISALVDLSCCSTVCRTTGEFNLMTTVTISGLDELSSVIAEKIELIRGVRRIDVRLCRRPVKDDYHNIRLVSTDRLEREGL